MKKFLLTAAIAAAGFSVSFAQTAEIGTPEWVAQQQAINGPAPAPQNGNNMLTVIYNNTACGLNYTMVSHRLGQRFMPVGVPQPTTYQLVLPPCAVVQQAYLYTEALGIAPSITATIVNPASASASYSMTNIGNSIDVCWGMNGTHIWRSDVTASVTGPGAYTISGFPTSTIANTATVDVEGATLIVIYSDPTASFTGTLKMDDGCYTVAGGTLNHTMTGFNACANSTSATAFMLVGDMQMPGYVLSMNNTSVVQPQWNWWNEISVPTAVTSGQTSCSFDIMDWSDCFTLGVAGLYYQTPCSSCTPTPSPIVLNTTNTPDFCNGNGTASVSAAGGSGTYTYLWSSGQTTATATGLPAGTYTVWVSDGATCVSTTVTIVYTGMTLTMSATLITCTTQGTATVAVTGGQAPYTYSWSSTPVQTTATATNLPTDIYTVTVTDAGGCVMTGTVIVYMPQAVTGVMTTTADSCNSSGTASVTAYYGTAPYSYLWSPGNQTTSWISGQAAGTYSVTITDATGCSVIVPANIAGLSPTVTVSPAASLYCGDTVQLATASTMSGSYSWSPSAGLDNPNSATPVCSATVSTTYTVTFTASCGTATDTVSVVVDTTNAHVEEICFVTVDTALNKNLVIWERWNSPANGNYNIYRETAMAGVYTLVGTQPVSQFSTFTDMSSTPSLNPDRYKITTVNPCGVESDTSFHHRTIYMTSTANGPGWDLSWTAYEGLPIALYNIYRGPTISSMVMIAQVSGSTFTYSDATPPPGIQYYMVEAVHPSGGCTPLRLSGPQAVAAYAGTFSNISAADQTSVNENNMLSASLLIIPNPGNGNFQLSMILSQAQEIQVNVYDNLGRNVYAQRENATAGIFSNTINLAALPGGIYFVQVQTANGFAVKRLVIN